MAVEEAGTRPPDGDETATLPLAAAKPDGPRATLIVIPCLNEARHIAGLLRQLIRATADLPVRIVVADGGSTDGTVGIVKAIAASQPVVTLLRNPRRIQSAAMNLAVERYGEGCEYLIRIDAHSRYPDDYCQVLLDEAAQTGADSVVVSMLAEGADAVQDAIATAQNARIGNGGSAHRNRSMGAFVDHGHHALMRIAAFRAVGGYDESFRWNEDAELDIRLRQAGFRIWLTAEVVVIYLPRRSLGALFRQYFGYGQGRAQTLLKHRLRPVARQAVVVAVAPVVVLAVLAAGNGVLALPAGLWAAACLGAGIAVAARSGRPSRLLAGVSAMVMHLAWSLGFWRKLISSQGLQTIRGGRT